MKFPLLSLSLLSLPALTWGSTLKISAGSAVRTADEVEADYTASHVYVDEVSGTTVPVTVFFDPQTTGVQTCEVFTNLNRRDRADDDADGDGIHDGIKLPNGNAIPTGSEAHYFKPYTMTGVSGGYLLTLQAQQTGVYRLTVRWRKTSDAPGTWRWYSDEASGIYKKRDHALVVSPQSAQDMRMYELNALNVESEGTLESQRSTFVDLHDGAGATRTPRWNLDYAKGLGMNWLWFQPIHPIGLDGRHLSAADINARQPGAGATTKVYNGGSPYEDVNYGYALGSPYAVKNFFEIEPRLSKGNTRAAAMAEFQAFVAAADNAGTDTMNVMLDAPFNHTSWDCELAQPGVAYFSPGAAATDQIRNREARFFSRSGNYGMRAFNAGSIAPAPDRGDFSKFLDANEVYFGRYASLVLQNPADNGNRLNEGDWFDTSTGNEGSFGDGHGHFDAVTQNVWRYFADYCTYWLTQTGCLASMTNAEKAWRGIDGLRADFAQGLPPQVWEYIVNRTRTHKWNFVFMAESLDGGEVSRRSSRHFDVMNEKILFEMKGLSVDSNNMTTAFRQILENRRTDYGQSMVLLNTTSHDEDNYSNEWEALIRYAVTGTNDGVPMLFSGQELGLNAGFGVDLWEKNFGKFIPHFKTWNSMMPLWNNSVWALAKPYQFCAGIGEARRSSPALRSPNRYFLNTMSGGAHQRIFSVAKFENRNGKPNFSDTVLAFVNLDRSADQNGIFNVNIDADSNGVNDFGIKAARTYRAKNIAAYEGVNASRRENFAIDPVTGSSLLGSGLSVTLRRLASTDTEWANTPFEPLYLKLYDVTPPNPPAASPAQPPYTVGSSFPVQWAAAVDDEAGISGYRVRVVGHILPTQVQFQTAATSVTVNSSFVPETGFVQVQVWSISRAGIESTQPLTFTLTRLSSSGDADGDGFTNGDEIVAGTDPADPASRFSFSSVAQAPSGALSLTFPSLASRRYTLRSSQDLVNWSDVSGAVSVPGTDGALVLTDGNPSGVRRYYRVSITLP